ncbi:DUF4222 domain-containing protein [Rahnella sp. CJA17(1/100)]|uniref:DUF4222 domain-containing protein n=1 Tax=Rahnella sp. CJA17(1/100) TaxID=2508951 RepID=UPI00106F988D|nr:DUF4222 domain-containing protein [Rahnella sp. CJA17(1/100)]
MNKKLTGFTASGQTQPEIRPGDIWKDRAGSKITISGFMQNRVTYIREGYEYPCISSVGRFCRDFIPVPDGAISEWCKTNNALAKTQKLKEMIQRGKK